MIRRAFILAFMSFTLCVSGVNTALAADLFVRPQNHQSESPQPSPEEQDEQLLELLDKAPPRAATAPAPQTINEFANAYYQNCMQKRHPILKGESLQEMCACTSAKIPDVMTVQNMHSMQENSDEGLLQRSRMLMFVYTPCIEFPTRALIMDACLNDPKVSGGFSNHRGVCTCMADGMAKFMREESPRYIEFEIRRNPNTLDPLGSFMDTNKYKSKVQYFTRKCVSKHVYKQ